MNSYKKLKRSRCPRYCWLLFVLYFEGDVNFGGDGDFAEGEGVADIIDVGREVLDDVLTVGVAGGAVVAGVVVRGVGASFDDFKGRGDFLVQDGGHIFGFFFGGLEGEGAGLFAVFFEFGGLEIDAPNKRDAGFEGGGDNRIDFIDLGEGDRE